MDYLRHVLELEDKFRVIAIVACAVAVLGLSIDCMVTDAVNAHTSGASTMSSNMNMRM